MIYSISNNKIFVDKTALDVKATLESGQVFRFEQIGEHSFLVPSGDKVAIVTEKKDSIEILSDTPEYFVNFFDLDNDYGKMLETTDEFALSAISRSPALRILRQEPFETVIDFIMSANNNIKRFSKTLDLLALKYGEKRVFEGYRWYTFPKAEVLQNASFDDLKAFGCGYRAEYILDTSSKIASGFDLEKPFALDTLSANKFLCSLKGVGEKVADCILLFAYQKYDAFPVDTWIEKVYREKYGGLSQNRKQIREFFVGKFGKYAGIIQQYLFFNARK